VKVFDTFLYSGIGTELDLLECRLRELEDSGVDKHVIIEGSLTFQGRSKPLSFLRDRARFKPWQDKIVYVPHVPSAVEPGKEPGAAWAREHSSRQAAHTGLRDAGAEPGDVILHGDVDEIPSRETIASLREHAREIGPCKLSLRFFMFAVDWEVPWPWLAPSVMRYGQVDDFTVLRETGWGTYPFVQPAGWHMTWLGGHQAMRDKANAFSHVERVAEIMAGIDAGKYYERGLMWAGGDRAGETQLAAVDVDERWPRYVRGGDCPRSWFRAREA
jgi:Glycosyltransferase family 17